MCIDNHNMNHVLQVDQANRKDNKSTRNKSIRQLIIWKMWFGGNVDRNQSMMRACNLLYLLQVLLMSHQVSKFFVFHSTKHEVILLSSKDFLLLLNFDPWYYVNMLM